MAKEVLPQYQLNETPEHLRLQDEQGNEYETSTVRDGTATNLVILDGMQDKSSNRVGAAIRAVADVAKQGVRTTGDFLQDHQPTRGQLLGAAALAALLAFPGARGVLKGVSEVPGVVADFAGLEISNPLWTNPSDSELQKRGRENDFDLTECTYAVEPSKPGHRSYVPSSDTASQPGIYLNEGQKAVFTNHPDIVEIPADGLYDCETGNPAVQKPNSSVLDSNVYIYQSAEVPPTNGYNAVPTPGSESPAK